MKTVKLSLAALAALSVFSTTSSASSLKDALTGGKISGDISVTFENREFDKDTSGYYQDTSYAVGSLAVKYETAAFNNFKLTSKFRAYTRIFEDDSDKATWRGKGDASERFYENQGGNDNGDIEELFLSYSNHSTPIKTDIKVGRQPLNTIWLNKTNDAFNANFAYEDTSLNVIWTKGFGRIYARDYRPINDINQVNKRDGMYKAELTQKYNGFALTGFTLQAPDFKDINGAQLTYDSDYFGFNAQYSETDEKTDKYEDSSHLQLKAYTKFAGYKFSLVHLITDEDGPFKHFGRGTTNAFEEGDHVYQKDAKTTYATISKSFGDLSVTALYGVFDYKKTIDKKEYDLDASEFDLWLGYKINNDLKLNVGYALTDEDSKDTGISDLNQINATLVYSF